MTYQTTRTGAQVDALLTKADSSVQPAYTGPTAQFDDQKVTLPGLSDASGIRLEFARWFAEGSAAGQVDCKNRVHAFGFRREDIVGGRGPFYSAIALEPAFQAGGAGSTIWGELHLPEIITRDNVARRLWSMTWDYGAAGHTGGLVGSVLTQRIHQIYYNSPVTDITRISINPVTGTQTWSGTGGTNGVTIENTATNARISVGQFGAQWDLASVDSSDFNLRFIGPFVWYATGNGSVATSAENLSCKNFVAALSSGNLAAQVTGIHPTHRVMATDIFGTVLGGIRNDGSLHVVPIAVASLPAATGALAGTRHFVNNANSTTFASVVAGGGANTVPVYCDGTNWRIG